MFIQALRGCCSGTAPVFTVWDRMSNQLNGLGLAPQPAALVLPVKARKESLADDAERLIGRQIYPRGSGLPRIALVFVRFGHPPRHLAFKPVPQCLEHGVDIVEIFVKRVAASKRDPVDALA